jgi:competence protein ComEC
VADRHGQVPETAGWIVALAGIIGWFVAQRRGSASAVVWLWAAAAGIAAAHHHVYRHSFPADDIGTFARETMTPARVRGRLLDEPSRFTAPKHDPLDSEQKPGTTSTVIAISSIETRDGWTPASGRLRLTVEGQLEGLHGGDLVEIGGRLWKPGPPGNPGERDYRSFLLDDRITAEMRVKRSADTVTRLEEGWRSSLFGSLGVLRSHGTRSLQGALPADESGLAAALLLGDNTALDRDEWDVYVRTGVIHVLAISGQHLAVLAAFLWIVLSIRGVRRRNGAWIVAGVIIAYTLLTGARPSAVRSAVMVSIVCAAIILRRRTITANTFALAWLVVIAINPTDPFTIGSQLSFLSVFVLVWGAAFWLAPRPLTPAERLIQESRTSTEVLVRKVIRWLWVLLEVSIILGAINAPLVLAWQNLVSPIGLLLGPPLIILTSIALIAGFALLIVAPFSSVAAAPFALVTEWTLKGCEQLVHAAQGLPGACVYAPAPPLFWLVVFYAGVGVMVLFPTLAGRSLAALIVWVVLGLAMGFRYRDADEARITFLSVGHGGCVVIEAPDGRVLLYDAGSQSGPDTVRRVIAPYLWHRGIQRIDEVFLSHADLDHFNGLPQLLRRYEVGRVTLTPSFPDKPTQAVAVAIAAMDHSGVTRRTAVAGDRFDAGSLTLEVLHPPPEGPPESENARSMVILLRYQDRTVLLTGDLEGEGQQMVLARPLGPFDVMLAPHHGGKTANAARMGTAGESLPARMALWARPRLVVSSQRPVPTTHLTAAYSGVGATVWDTPTAGAVTVRCHATGVVAESFLGSEVKVIGRGR